MSGVDWGYPQCVENFMHFTAIRVLILAHTAQVQSVPGFRVSSSTTCYLIQMLGNMWLKDPNLDGTIWAGSFLSSGHKLGYPRRSNIIWRLSPSAWPLDMCVKHLTVVIWCRRAQVAVGIVTPGKVKLSSVRRVTEQTRVWCRVSNGVSPSSSPQSHSRFTGLYAPRLISLDDSL